MAPKLGRSWIIWACAALFFCYQFLLRVSPSVMTHELMADFHVGACSLGLLTSFYFYAYAGLQLPVGTLLDTYGPRRLLTFAALLCTGGSILFATSETIYMASLGRFLIGAGSAFGFLSSMKLGTLWFPPQKISMIIGLTLLLGTLGAMSGSYPMSFLVDGFGWRQAVWITAVGGIALAFLAATVIRDTPPKKLKEYIETHHPHGNPTLTIFEGLKIILKKGQTWILALYGIMMFAPLAGFADVWGVPFLTHVHHIDKQSASFSISLLYLGVGLGTPMFAFFSDYFKQYKQTLFSSAFLALLPFSFVLYGQDLPMPLIALSLFLVGLFLGGQFMTYSIVCEINPLSVSGMATGFQNMICLLSGVIFQPFIGHLLDLFWQESYENGIRVYSTGTYRTALTSLIITFGIAIIASLFIKEAYPEREG